jgi:hypothetical protein
MYLAVRNSIVRFITNQITALQQNGTSANLTYTDFDAHGDLTTLSKNDTCGIHAFTLHDEDQFQTTIFGITVSTYDDPNLSVMTTIIDWFYNQMRVRQRIDLLDSSTGLVIGEIHMMVGTSVMPVERSDTRAAMFIQAHATVTVNPT